MAIPIIEAMRARLLERARKIEDKPNDVHNAAALRDLRYMLCDLTPQELIELLRKD